MASDLKRVGLDFQADGVEKFNRSIKEVSASVQTNRAEFKAAKSQWDSNTTSMEKIKTTQTYLAKQTQDYSNKLSIQKKELIDLENAENRDAVAIEKKKAQITNTTTTLNNYQKGLKDVNTKLESGQAQLQEYADKIKKVGDTMTSAGKTLTKDVTAPIVALGTAAEAAWKVLDDAYDNIILLTGATGDKLDSLTDSFDNIYGNFAFESADVSNAIGDINTRFGLTGDSLTDVSTKFLEYSQITGQDVLTATKSAQRIMQQYGLSIDDTINVMDLMTKVSQDTGISIDDLTSYVGDNADVFKALGFNVEESVNLLGQFEKAGIDSTTMMTGLKKAAQNWESQGKSAKEGLQELITNIQQSDDAVGQYGDTVADIVGSRNKVAFINMAKQGKISLDDLSTSLDDYKGTVENTFDATQDPADRATAAFHSVQTVLADLGGYIQEVFAPILEDLSDSLQDFSKWFKDLNPDLKETIVIVGMIAAAIGPLLVVIGAIAGPVSTAIEMFGGLKAALFGAEGAAGLLGGTLTAISGPVIAIVAIIGLVIAAIVQLWNTSDTFRKSITDAIDSIGKIVKSLYDSVIAPIVSALMEGLSTIWNDGLKPLWDSFVGMVEDIGVQISGLITACQPIITFLVDTLGPIISVVISGIIGAVAGLITGIMNGIGGLLEFIGSVVGSIIGVLTGIITFITGVFSGNWKQAWEGISSAFKSVFDGLVAIAKSPINLIIGIINSMIKAIQSAINAVIKAVNTLHFDVPDWVPIVGGQKWGFDFDKVSLGQIPYLAKGGTLTSGMAMIAEAGPELLFQNGNSSTVMPLTSGGGATPTQIIDYNKLAEVLILAMSNVSVKLDKRQMGKLVNEVII